MGYHNNPKVISIREGENFDQVAFRDFLFKRIQDLPNEPIEIKQFSTGVSNLTYLIRCGEWEAVMRRPPNGPLPPKAHDMKRESELLKKLHSYYPFVPKPYVFCDDEKVIGVPFYIMERKKGIVLDDKFPQDLEITKEQLKLLSYEVVDALAQLHQVNYKEAGLAKFGHPEGFLERQVHGWIKRFKRSKTDDVPHFEQLSNWFVKNVPTAHDHALIHNDYKLNNMLLSNNLQEIKAILDWEMATIADPIFDLAGALGYWIQHDDPEILKNSLPSITATPGFITRDEFTHLYSLKTKKDIPNMNFYMAFTYFKLAIVFQQIYYRWKIGKTKDERFATFDKNVKDLMTYSYEIVNK